MFSPDSGVPVEVESVAPEQGGQIKPSDESVVATKAADSEVAHPKVVVGGPEPVSSSSSIHPKQVVGGCEPSSTVISVTEFVRGTLEQTRREQIERDTDETLSAESECVPREVELSRIIL